MNKKIGLIGIYIFVVFSAFFYFFPNFLLTLELKVFDNFTVLARSVGYFFPELRPSQHLDKIVTITVDEATVLKLKKKLPLPRYLFAELLHEIYKGDPRLIVFDIVFTGESENKEHDVLLAAAIAGKDNILLPYAKDDAGRPLGSDEFFIKDLIPAGYINKPIDSDSKIRRIQPITFSVDNNIRDFATEFHIFADYYGYDLDYITVDKKRVFLNDFKPEAKDKFYKRDFSLIEDNTIRIKYHTDGFGFNRIPMWRVLSDDFDHSIFKDKVVIVGVTAKIMHDIHGSPLGMMAGMDIMANVALMLLDGQFFQESPDWLRWILVFVFCMLIVFLCYRLPILKGFLFVISLVSMVVVISFGLFLINYYLNPFKLVFICLLSYVVVNFYKYGSVVLENMNLRRLSTTDELTGLHTFRFFQVVISHEFQKCLRYKTPVSLFMIDIDNFKKVNDNYGHQNGNVVLKKIGKIIINNARKSDFPVRYGGEELAVLLPHTDTEGAYKCAETIRQLIEKEDFFMTKQGPKKVTVSIGISSFPSMDITSEEDMVKFADTALYKAKHEGKNRVIIYTEEAKKSIDAG